MQNVDASPDSLIAEYNKVSARIKKYTDVQVTSSKILSFVHEVAGKSGIVLNDLSTGEMRYSENETEIPVSFRTRASFVDVLKFLKELENGMFCIRTDDVNMAREEKGVVAASVRFSVLSLNAKNTMKASSSNRAALSLGEMLALLKPQEITFENLRDPFSLPKSLLPKPKSASVKVVKPKELPPPKEHPPITLDAILPGNNPVAILKFRGESAVVSVGQKIWDVTVVAIKNDRVILRDEIGKFELKY
ncbi:GspMb/PilO family protein [Fibrobacter sp.]|uniref:GspMb/PilO family protein n=1 Tax=Fibrobacter sp. TaxID=35828 RepID=UPI00386E1FB0